MHVAFGKTLTHETNYSRVNSFAISSVLEITGHVDRPLAEIGMVVPI
jgi:hypothetical protein